MSSPEQRFETWEGAVSWLRAQPDRQDLVRAAYYDDPLIEAAERYRTGEEWAEVRRRMGPGAGRSALDVGAGRGIASYALARDGFAVSALEPDPSALVGAAAIRALADEAGVRIDVVEEFSERLPFQDAAFDVVFARAVLHHTSDLAQACSEFFRVLKPGGRFVAVREHVISSQDQLPAFLEIHPLHSLYGGENAFLLQQYRDAIAAAGFVLTEELTPLGSAINFAPLTGAGVKDEIAARLGALGKAARPLFDAPGVWPLARAALTRVDHRPGRLYSFICDKP
ncbi:MAG: methyltransferase domain-containing protein [Alphaproteobacteria bacterium]|nr:methyltransferase domain-containing protein [Alphaproteobacteria bacterium]MBU1525484.1 methyltransferase domain-containing protein [Alphaproteobacteria bacterium]MBU2350886.1 methyltransferase domain-containing protein [Alphaproteobacteria bacterium]MBU2381733.1 methyltransferase domain-containing protein [Alphaproteobacteria bacterium]